MAAGIVVVLDARSDEDPATVAAAPRPDRDERAVLGAAALRQLEQAVEMPERAPVDAASATTVAVTNAAALDASGQALRDFHVRYVEEDPGALTTGSGSATEWVAAVDASWAFGGFDERPARTQVSVTFRLDGDRAQIVSIGGHDRRTPLWLTEPVSVRQSRDALVLAAAGPRVADRYLRLAARAVGEVRRVLPHWRQGLVVEVPSSASELDAELDAQPGEYAQIAAVTTSVDGRLERSSPVHVFVNPEVFGPLRAQGAQVVLSHEATHVATGAATAAMPLWLVEGFADYVALRDLRLPISVTAGQLTEQVRGRGVPEQLPTDQEFGTGQSDLEATYQAAWLACRVLAEIGGEDALVRYYEAVRAGADPALALRRVFGISQQTFIEKWQERLRHLAS